MSFKNKILIMAGILSIFYFVYAVSAVYFSTSGTSSYVNESQYPVFSYNLTSNVTNVTTDIFPFTFSIRNFSSSLYPSQVSSSFYSWFSLNSSTGVLAINATNDNQTGRFNVSVEVLNSNSPQTGTTDVFYFIVNATNDAPEFTNISLEYNLTMNQNFLNYINASDEESHYPLYFNISFNSSCSHTLIPGARTNCSIFSFFNFSNASAMMNFTPLNTDVGVYYANVSVRDFAEAYNCSSGYCSPDYSQNKTSYYSQIIVFNIFANLEINASDCKNKVFQENISNTCQINVTTRGINDIVNATSLAFLNNYAGTVSNISWFYSQNITSSSNYLSIIYINATPAKTAVGNWTINFTIIDTNFNQTATEPIYIHVNRTFNDAPELADLPNKITSINLLTRINISVYDDDLMIPDKNQALGGYNESTNFTVRILNQSNLSQVLALSNLSVQILNMPVSGTNITEAKIEFTPNSTDAGNYTINITARDKENSLSSKVFNFTILNNQAPSWNSSVQTVFVYYEGNRTYLNLSMNISDADGDALSFSSSSDTSFSSFNLSSTTGEINFSSVDADVGQHLVTITASDGYLTASKVFNFTIYNVNDAPYIEKPILAANVINASVDANSNIVATEDNTTQIILWIQDEDFRIPSGQKNFYNESLTLNLTIQGFNTSLFSFTKDNSFPTASGTNANKSRYYTNFILKKEDIGAYNITINLTDLSNVSDVLRLNFTLSAVEHGPVIVNLINYTSAVSRNVYYRINASDAEDGNSYTIGNYNLTFNCTFLNGTDFINFNNTIFNSTTGELNITFNSTHGGIYRLNITVNDTTNRINSKDFWIFVYDTPTINSPASSFAFSLLENSTYNFTFNVNHSVRDNLAYNIYFNYPNLTNIYNQTYFGNGSNLSFQFTPNFLNETNGIRNLTLIAYPSNTELSNNINVNATRTWNITINHTNYPLSFSGDIGGLYHFISGSSPQTVALSSYFQDYDASDTLYNQTIRFAANVLYIREGSITTTITDWINTTIPSIGFSAASHSIVNYSITGYEYNVSNLSQIIRNVTSNNFSVELNTTTLTTTVTVYSSSSRTIPVAFKILVPTKISAFAYRKIEIPIRLVNKGDNEFNFLSLSAQGFKGGNIADELKLSLDKNYFTSLPSGKSENITLTALFETNISGDYEIIVTANSKEPVYSDFAKIYINLQKTNESDTARLLLFTEELIVDNPNCLELKEMLEEAKKDFDAGNYFEAKTKAENIITACKDYIAQASLASQKFPELGLNTYFYISLVSSFLIGLSYYYLKRRRLRNSVKISDIK
jgi:hypothetical protein